MPELSRFYGIVIQMFYADHAPPHFHAKYAGKEAAIAIGNGEVIEGALPRIALRLVREWSVMHEGELLEVWKQAASRMPPGTIVPLD